MRTRARTHKHTYDLKRRSYGDKHMYVHAHGPLHLFPCLLCLCVCVSVCLSVCFSLSLSPRALLSFSLSCHRSSCPFHFVTFRTLHARQAITLIPRDLPLRLRHQRPAAPTTPRPIRYRLVPIIALLSAPSLTSPGDQLSPSARMRCAELGLPPSVQHAVIHSSQLSFTALTNTMA